MTLRLETQADVDAGVRTLLARDPRLAPVVAAAGRTLLRRRPGGFAGLASIIVAQQLSTASANAIWTRLAAAFDPLEPDRIRRSRATTLARLGLSAPKIRTFKAITTASSPPSTASVRGRPTSISCSASATPTPGRPATSPCRRRCVSRSG
jgi:3-methyladenine DNA glycosylase/8-oxoguanine DNA glycosylase